MISPDQQRIFDEVLREHRLIRENNLNFKQGDVKTYFFPMAEGALVTIALERFLRMFNRENISTYSDSDNIFNLLEQAQRFGLVLPHDDPKKLITGINSVRNTLLHANYEQAASQESRSGVGDYFSSGNYISEVETLWKILCALWDQVDPVTWKLLPKSVGRAGESA